jgi:hypothetical protein
MAKDYIVHKAIRQGALSKKLKADINPLSASCAKYDGAAIFCYDDDGEFVNTLLGTGSGATPCSTLRMHCPITTT